MIEAIQLEKSFGAIKAVRGVSFIGKNGEITGLLGPNGAGKTTTIRMIGTLVSIGGGSARIDGIEVGQDPAGALAACGFLTDARGLYTRMTARENIRYYAELRGIDRTRAERTISRYAEWLDMGTLLDRRTDGFSQGERMKVAIARALVHEPQNVVLDEPTNGLDVMSTRALRELIKRLRAEGRAVLFSSHIMQEVAALCDRIVIVAQGKVMASGTPEEIVETAGKSNLEDAFVSLAGIDATPALEAA